MSLYIIQSTGELTECENKEVAISSDNVLLVISHEQKRIYTWIGNQAAPQSKFACARETARIRMELGYKIMNLEEADTSDEFIEWIHSNIAGGEDPFARKYYGLNHAGIRYIDENGKILHLDKGNLIISGIEFSYNYYPQFKLLKKKNIYTNYGLQLGVNVSEINASLDLGFNSSIVKKIKIKTNNEFGNEFEIL